MTPELGVGQRFSIKYINQPLMAFTSLVDPESIGSRVSLAAVRKAASIALV